MARFGEKRHPVGRKNGSILERRGWAAACGSEKPVRTLKPSTAIPPGPVHVN